MRILGHIHPTHVTSIYSILKKSQKISACPVASKLLMWHLKAFSFMTVKYNLQSIIGENCPAQVNIYLSIRDC